MTQNREPAPRVVVVGDGLSAPLASPGGAAERQVTGPAGTGPAGPDPAAGPARGGSGAG
jgi:hypothetical protein